MSDAVNDADTIVASTETPEYRVMLTHAGSRLEAQAHAAGATVRLTHIALGDGNGQVPQPDQDETALVHEVYRRAIDSRRQDADDPNICWLNMVIPANDGGFWIRELGVYAEPLSEGGEPVLYAYGNYPPYYKIKKINGQAVTHEIAIPLVMTGTADVEIIVSDVGYATREQLSAFADATTRAFAGVISNVIRLSDRLTRHGLEVVDDPETHVVHEPCGCGCNDLEGVDLVATFEQALADVGLGGGTAAESTPGGSTTPDAGDPDDTVDDDL
ncbi:MAG: phage tail protein [Desulfovibrio sp.]|nr:phage tail protein [Desulfovibrio sp.]